MHTSYLPPAGGRGSLSTVEKKTVSHSYHRGRSAKKPVSFSDHNFQKKYICKKRYFFGVRLKKKRNILSTLNVMENGNSVGPLFSPHSPSPPKKFIGPLGAGFLAYPGPAENQSRTPGKNTVSHRQEGGLT